VQFQSHGLRTILVNLPKDTETVWELRPLLKLTACHPRMRFAVVLIYPDHDRVEKETDGSSWLPVGDFLASKL